MSGGRILGLFLDDQSPALYWLNAAWQDADTFKAFVASGDWNMGGERVWIAPEVQYIARDRAIFEASLQLPPQMSPGNFTLTRANDATWQLHNHLTLDAYNVAHGSKTLELKTTVQPADDPLRGTSGYPVLLDGIVYAGYEQVITLAEHATDDIPSASWNLIQLQFGGRWIMDAALCRMMLGPCATARFG